MSIGSSILQKNYIDIYRCVRKYILPFNVVEHLVDFELSVYRAVPDMDEVETMFARFKSSISDIIRQDDDLKKSIDSFSDSIRGENTSYSKIKTV